ncbi:MAG: XRE family transcriptional regulator [Desulfovibrio sp.]|jgi:Zn-dependent peptidase ImmA (M78 family)/DNA-binding XRE family transcriptional regulator|nr:XRE family transcriptional regulator [Desulfovibrio sp.]
MKNSGFIAARLVQVREARGLRQASLAMLSGLTRQSISNYESGKQIPREEAIEQMAKALNIPEAFFFKPPPQADTPIFFRSFSGLTKLLRLQGKRLMEWLEEIYTHYSEYIDFPHVDIPQHNLGKNWANTHPREIDAIADSCRKYFEIGNAPISNLAHILESHGVIMSRIDLDSHEDGFSSWIDNGTRPAMVLSSEKRASCRDRLSQAHELGHLVMHKDIVPDEKNIKTLEFQAYRFASSFLMPETGYSRDFSFPSLNVFRALKQKWGVSISAQIVRCSQLEIISDDTKRKLFINCSRKGWRTHEPLDDTIPLEPVVFLKKSTELLINEGGFTKHSLIDTLGISVSDVSMLVGLSTDYFKETPLNNATAPKILKFQPRQ